MIRSEKSNLICIRIGNIAPQVTSLLVFEYFSRFGKVFSHQVRVTPSDGSHSTIGFVLMDKFVAENLSKDTHILGGSQLDLRMLPPKKT